MSYFQVKIKNSSAVFDPGQIHITAKGQNPSHHSDTTYDLIESYLDFDGQGQGNFVAISEGMPSSAHAKLLSAFPRDPADGSYSLYLPKTIGGRIFMTLGKPMPLTVTVGLDTKKKPVALTLVEPDPFKIDADYSTIYDKVEFTYNDDGVWINTTAVDFFCMPLTLRLGSGDSVGLNQGRAAVLSRLKGDLTGTDWPKLILSDPNDENNVLRVVAPNKAFGRPTGDFDVNYLRDYIAAVWQYYKAHEIKVDCSELIGFKYPLTDIAGGKLTAANSLFTGSVLADGQTFRFENSTNDRIDVGLPSSNQVLGCDGGSMTAVANTASSVVVRELGPALNLGLLPLSGTPTLSREFFISEAARRKALSPPESLYGNSPLLPATLGAGPWYNLYSKSLHSFGDKVYAFAFDDAVGEDSTQHTTDLATPATVTIGDMTGTTIPTQKADETTYTTIFYVGGGASGSFTNTNDANHPHKTYDLLDPLVHPGPPVTVTDVKSPFVITYNHGSGDHEYKITVNTGLAEPQLDGLTVNVDNVSGSGSNRTATAHVHLPGAPA